MSATWSPDGKMLAYASFASIKGMEGTIKAKPANGGGAERVLVSEPGNSLLHPQFTPDGRFIAFIRSQNGRGAGIFAKPLSGEGPTITLVPDPGPQADIFSYRISPNGRWVAYNANQGSQTEVYVAPFSGSEGKWQASDASGGTYPTWSGDSKQLFYITTTSELYAVQVSEVAGGLQLGAPQRLFQTTASSIGTIYDVTADGQKFVVNTTSVSSHDTLNLMTNWTAQLKK